MLFLISAWGRVAAGGHSSLCGQGVIRGLPTVFVEDPQNKVFMKRAIRRQNLGDEFYTPEGCHIIEVSNSSDDPDTSIARARLEAGKTTRWHRLVETAERYVILQGQGRVEIGSLPPAEVSVGDVALIPPMCRQRITNTGPDDLIFLAICTPRFSYDAYEDINDNPGEK